MLGVDEGLFNTTNAQNTWLVAILHSLFRINSLCAVAFDRGRLPSMTGQALVYIEPRHASKVRAWIC